MSKHTTGPWSFSHEMMRWFSVKKDGYWVARVRGFENAKLIAAAPDLLETLQGVVAFWDKLNFDGSAINELHTAARAAIRKATE